MERQTEPLLQPRHDPTWERRSPEKPCIHRPVEHAAKIREDVPDGRRRDALFLQPLAVGSNVFARDPMQQLGAEAGLQILRDPSLSGPLLLQATRIGHVRTEPLASCRCDGQIRERNRIVLFQFAELRLRDSEVGA